MNSNDRAAHATKQNRRIQCAVHIVPDTVEIRLTGAIEAAASVQWRVLFQHNPFFTPHPPHWHDAYEPAVPRIPHAALAPEDVERLARFQERGTRVKLQLRMLGHHEENATSRNVVAEIPGREIPGEIIVLGGHIDSWMLARERKTMVPLASPQGGLRLMRVAGPSAAVERCRCVL
jgi:hypothetical protein